MTHTSPRTRFTSVRVRLTLWNVGVVALVFGVLAITLRWAMLETLTSGLDHSLDHFATDLSQAVLHAPPPPLYPQRVGPPSGEGPQRGGRLHPRFLTLLGEPLNPASLADPAIRRDPNAPPATDPPLDSAALRRVARPDGPITLYTRVHAAGETDRVATLAVVENGRRVAILQLGRPMTEIYAAVNQLTRVLLALIPLELLVAGLAGAFLTGRALQPVREITRAAGRIEAENLSDRLSVGGGDEFALLASTFNAMLDRLENAFRHLEAAYEQQRRFTGDASHELRSPLTIIKANASLALSGERTPEQYVQTLTTINQAADRTNRIIQDLLMLARADAGQLAASRVPVDIAEILDHAAAPFAAAPGARVLWQRPETATAPAADMPIYTLGNSDMLRRLFENILSNATRHTPPAAQGGEIRITLTPPTPASQKIDIAITDNGEGIPADHLPRLTERFYRVDGARTRAQGGTGLGLAICQSIVDAHHGHLALASPGPGLGTTARVTLPLWTPVPIGDAPAGEPPGALQEAANAS